MNHILKKFFITSIMFMTFITSCTDDVLDEIDTNPNSPLEVPIVLLMPQVTVSAAFGVSGTDLAWYSSVFVEHTTGVHGQLEDADKRSGINTTMVNNSWNTIYADQLNDLQTIIQRGSEGGEEEGSWTSVGIAKVLFAHSLGIATDLWGKVPYTQALQGSETRQPEFDDQQAIYSALQSMLDEAIADLAKEPETGPGAADFYYGGNAALWTKAAYALKARFHNRLSKIDPEGSATAALAAAQNSFASPAESMIFSDFTTDATGENPWYQESNDRGHHAVSATFDNILVELNDPRREHFATEVDGAIVPAPNGTAITDQAGVLYSRASSNVVNATAPLPIITYDEVKFIEAEAHLRLNQGEAALESYEMAVVAALMRQGIEDEEEIETYTSQASVMPATLTLEHVLTQKYISFWIYQPIEAYNDYRRTGIPTLTNTVGPPPRRFPYAQDEIAANQNVPVVPVSNGVWWDDQTED